MPPFSFDIYLRFISLLGSQTLHKTSRPHISLLRKGINEGSLDSDKGL
jgi:hypothetical protein